MPGGGDSFPYPGADLDLGGIRLHYVDEGRGPAVVLLHGNPTWSYFYRHLIAALRPRFRVVAPDHVGCGRSGRPPARLYPYTAARRVEDLDRLLDHLGLDRIDLVVHDWGGAIGLRWATRNPSRLRRLVVLNAAAFPIPEGKRIPAPLRLLRAPGIGELLVVGTTLFVRLANRACVAGPPMAREVARRYLEPCSSRSGRRAHLAFLRDIPESPSHPTHALLEQTARGLAGLAGSPALLCWGLADRVLDADYLTAWRRHLPHAEVLEVPGAGHYVLEDSGGTVVPRIAAFLEAAEPRGESASGRP